MTRSKKTKQPTNVERKAQATAEGKDPYAVLKRALQIAHKSGYKPYTGGAGPSNEQVKGNNAALARALTLIGYNAKAIRVIDEITNQPVDVVSLNGRHVCYDRWGFCNINEDNLANQLDQASLLATAEYLIG